MKLTLTTGLVAFTLYVGRVRRRFEANDVYLTRQCRARNEIRAVPDRDDTAGDATSGLRTSGSVDEEQPTAPAAVAGRRRRAFPAAGPGRKLCAGVRHGHQADGSVQALALDQERGESDGSAILPAVRDADSAAHPNAGLSDGRRGGRLAGCITLRERLVELALE